MTCRYYIGLDPGKSTGYAVWDSEKKEFECIETLTFWEAVQRVEYYRHDDFHYDHNHEIVIEDPAQNKPTFFRPGTTQRQMYKISQNVGANKEHGRLLIERFESLGLQVDAVKPKGNDQEKLNRVLNHKYGNNPIPARELSAIKKTLKDTKNNAANFKFITGYSGRTSEHGRDAAMLVFGR